jgi:1-acyl-sn-glycerol-3-phosphate acyltransferase
MTNANSAGSSPASATRSASNRLPLKASRASFWRLLYGIYAWLQFVLVATLGLPVVLLVPTIERRRAIIRALARLSLRMAGMRIHTRDLSSIPLPCILVANHCSYIDGVVLQATLPPHFSFVIKTEMSRVPLAGTLLRRIGAQFVDRSDRRRGQRDTRRLLRSATRGQAMAFFPEGTFSHEVGLLKFHVGAFAAAVRAHLPVVTVAIRGTRHCLPANSIWPRPGVIQVDVLGVLDPPAADAAIEDRDATLKLRDAAREQILGALGEPDLTIDPINEQAKDPA